MGYISDKLKEVLGGSKIMDTKNTVIRDWTPNNLKVLIINRNYILALFHLGGHKVVNLDTSQVVSDIDNMSRTSISPKLNSVLKRRSFSCLEEIYVDAGFIGNNQVIDLVEYVKELSSSNSRLRFFGYGDFPLGSDSWVINSYLGNRKNLDYSLAEDSSKPFTLDCRKVGYSEWYSNYYLRPQYYKLDEDNGRLSIYFKKFENEYKQYLAKKSLAQESEDLNNKVRYIISTYDVPNISVLKKFDEVLYEVSKDSEDNIKKILFKVFKKHINQKNIVKGLSVDVLSKALSGIDDSEYLMKSYTRFGVVDSIGSNLSVEDVDNIIKEGKGFLSIGHLLDCICVECAKVLVAEGYKNLVGVALIVSEKDIPIGSFRDTFIKRGSSNSSNEGYFSFLSEIIGVDL